MTNNNFDTHLEHAPERLNELYQRNLRNGQTSYAEHVDSRRASIVKDIQSKKIIYFDTNAWKCISDFNLGKTTLTPEMVAFAELATDERILREMLIYSVSPS